VGAAGSLADVLPGGAVTRLQELALEAKECVGDGGGSAVTKVRWWASRSSATSQPGLWASAALGPYGSLAKRR
jgi:hypothetical protein